MSTKENDIALETENENRAERGEPEITLQELLAQRT